MLVCKTKVILIKIRLTLSVEIRKLMTHRRIEVPVHFIMKR